MTNPVTTEPGKYYLRAGALVPVGDAPGPPDVVVCRRVVDYAPQPVPGGAAFTQCRLCTSVVAFDPDGPHQHVGKICMQCAGIKPLPIVIG